MKIMERDIEVMGWILEQKFMTEQQVRRIFWKDITEESREAYKRLYELQKEGYLKTSKKKIYRHALYLVTRNGVNQLKSFGRNRGLGELADADYSNYKHDIAVTDLRVLLHDWGYTDWVSERVLARRNDLRRIPDGMLYHRGKYFAIEYELTQKSKDRYREIFYNYELDNQVDEVVYIVETPEMAAKLSQEAATCNKLHFVPLADLQKNQVNAHLRGIFDQCSLHELLEAFNQNP